MSTRVLVRRKDTKMAATFGQKTSVVENWQLRPNGFIQGCSLPVTNFDSVSCGELFVRVLSPHVFRVGFIGGGEKSRVRAEASPLLPRL